MIISGGLKFYPRDVDEIVFSQPKILDGGVMGVPDAYSGERIKAFVDMKPGMKPTADETIA
jgi:long-chain acyl-CoA synthetase